jgi:hypothetical protein
MFTTSGDVLNLVLSICIVALTIFLCLALFYLISSVQKTHKIIKRVESGITKAEEVIGMAREKMKNGAAYLMILGELAKRGVDYFSEKAQEKRGEKMKATGATGKKGKK